MVRPDRLAFYAVDKPTPLVVENATGPLEVRLWQEDPFDLASLALTRGRIVAEAA